MDYRNLVKRIDEMQMSAGDRAAAKARLAQAERLMDWTSAAAAGLKGSAGASGVNPIRRGIARIRSSFERIGSLVKARWALR